MPTPMPTSRTIRPAPAPKISRLVPELDEPAGSMFEASLSAFGDWVRT